MKIDEINPGASAPCAAYLTGLAFTILIALASPGALLQCQTKTASAHVSPDAALAMPTYWAELHLRMFKDTVSTVDFDLATSAFIGIGGGGGSYDISWRDPDSPSN
jgi:hypothetical protein